MFSLIVKKHDRITSGDVSSFMLLLSGLFYSCSLLTCMQYRTFLKQTHGDGCPFCEHLGLDRKVIIREDRYAMVTVAKAPYVSDQLLVIPKRHVETFSQLRFLESLSCLKLLRWITQRLYRQGYAGYSILLRDGDGVGKSIPHLHIHIIPDLDIHIKNGSSRRKLLTPEEIAQTVKKFQTR